MNEDLADLCYVKGWHTKNLFEKERWRKPNVIVHTDLIDLAGATNIKTVRHNENNTSRIKANAGALLIY